MLIDCYSFDSLGWFIRCGNYDRWLFTRAGLQFEFKFGYLKDFGGQEMDSHSVGGDELRFHVLTLLSAGRVVGRLRLIGPFITASFAYGLCVCLFACFDRTVTWLFIGWLSFSAGAVDVPRLGPWMCPGGRPWMCPGGRPRAPAEDQSNPVTFSGIPAAESAVNWREIQSLSRSEATAAGSMLTVGQINGFITQFQVTSWIRPTADGFLCGLMDTNTNMSTNQLQTFSTWSLTFSAARHSAKWLEICKWPQSSKTNGFYRFYRFHRFYRFYRFHSTRCRKWERRLQQAVQEAR